VEQREDAMNQVTCECGFAARAPQEDQVVDDVLAHVSADHPDLAPAVTPDVVRGWIEVVPD
jgi:predicted small metal-binding protein